MQGIRTVLENWGRWAKDRYHKQHCASLEHRYRSPQEWGDWENAAPGQSVHPIDVLDAVEVQKIIGRLGFQFAWALTFRYCYPRYDRWAAARVCKVYRPERLEKLAGKAEFAFKNLYQSRERGGYKDSKRKTVQAEILVAREGSPASRQGEASPKIAETV